MRKHRFWTAERRRSFAGFSFVIPWVIGFMGLYLFPLIQSLKYSFQDLGTFNDDGSLTPVFVGLANFKRAFMVDPDYAVSLTNSLRSLLMDIPSILIFSLLVAMILNQNFRGRFLARAVFFLPVIIASGVVIDILNGDVTSAMMKAGEKSSGSMFQVSVFQNTLLEAGLSQEIVDFISDSANNIFELSWRSGVQILLFLAGLQAIPPSLYEAADMDGCTAWECFWKITFPMLSSVMLVNLVYSITDTFVSYGNETMKIILREGQNMHFAYSAAQAWIYFSVIMLVLGAVVLLTRRHITYLDK